MKRLFPVARGLAHDDLASAGANRICCTASARTTSIYCSQGHGTQLWDATDQPADVWKLPPGEKQNNLKKKKQTQKNNRKKSDKWTAREKAGLGEMPISSEAAQKRGTCRRSLDGVFAPCYDIPELQPAGPQGSSNELPSHSKPGLATPHLPSTGSPNN